MSSYSKYNFIIDSFNVEGKSFLLIRFENDNYNVEKGKCWEILSFASFASLTNGDRRMYCSLALKD